MGASRRKRSSSGSRTPRATRFLGVPNSEGICRFGGRGGGVGDFLAAGVGDVGKGESSRTDHSRRLRTRLRRFRGSLAPSMAGDGENGRF